MAGEFIHRPLGSVARVRSGFAFKSSDMGTCGAPIIKIKNICPPTVDINNCERVPERVIASIPGIERYELKHGDILIAMTGATVGKVGRFPKVEERYFLNQRVGKVYLVEDNSADYRYLYYVLSQDAYVRAMFGVADGSAQANISGGQIERLEIPLPELSDQRAIACILGALDDKIELNRRMNRTLEEMARAIFKSWFVDFDPVRAKAAVRREHPKWTDAQVSYAACPNLKPEIAALFPDSFENSELGEIPKGWRVGSFSTTVEIVGGGTPKTSIAEYWDGDIPWFSVVDAPKDSDVWVIDTEKKVTAAGIENSSTRVLPIGTTIISARGTVGRIALVGVPMAMNQSCYGLKPRPGKQGFFNYFATRELVARLQQHAHGSVFDTITRDTLAGVSVVVPPLTLVEKYEEAVAPDLNRIRLGLLQSRTIAALRDALLPKLIYGEIRIKGAEKFVEGAL